MPIASLSATALQALHTLLADYDRPGVPGASVLVLRNGHAASMHAYGLANLEEPTPATTRTSYRLASLSKQFTAMGVMLLANEGRLHYDSRAADFLPELPAYADEVRILHLLHHTSGLWDYEDFVPKTQDWQVRDIDILPLLARADRLYFQPGTEYRYSNTGYALLALLVERASGLPFARFLHERIFAPLGMSGAVAYEPGRSTVLERAYGYTLGEGYHRTDQSPTSAVLGDGGIYASIEDLAKWAQSLDTNTLLPAAAYQSALMPPLLASGERSGYGFGWFVDSYQGEMRLHHHGRTIGFTNAIQRFPTRGLTIALLTNRTSGAPWKLAQHLAELFL